MLPLFTLLRRIAEPTPFLYSSFPPPEIFLFWRNSIAITPSGTQKVLPIPVGRKYSIGLSLLAVVPSLTFSLLSPLSPFLAPGRCLRTWVLITNQFYYPSLHLWSFAPTNVLLYLIFRKLTLMTLLFTLALTVLLQKNTRLFLFSLLVLS